tara:strand:+ start:9001 stop:9258 length:258 start_codon:yes stop_codon:yes gene_type:complete
MTIEETLDAREKTHGDFGDVSAIAQAIKQAMREPAKRLDPDEREALEMIATKMARILCGKARASVDSYLDIEGYARLVRERIGNE